MKKIILTMALIMTLAIAFPHPPSKVKLNYDKTKKTLKIEVIHKVHDVNNHYIGKILIFVNNSQKEVKTFTKQSNAEFETYLFNAGDVKPGEKIKVTAYCSKFGSKSAEITVN